MNLRKIVLLALLTVCLAAYATTAVAGKRSTTTVYIGGDYAKGTFLPTRNSSDSVQYIGCSYFSYENGNVSATCYAKNSSGTYKSCSTSDPKHLEAVKTLSSHSYLYFKWSGSTCTKIITNNVSYNL